MKNEKSVNEIDELINIILFGSKARKDNDLYSDADIFILVEDVSQIRKKQIIEIVEKAIDFDNVGISIYTKSLFDKLLQEGSMFLWHLKMEGKNIYCRDKEVDLFENLNEFTKYEVNLKTYINIFNKTKESLSRNGVNIFDLSQLFFVCRNLCLLTCFRKGTPTFGRITVYTNLSSVVSNMPLSLQNYKFLSKCRLNYTRAAGLDIPMPSEKYLSELLLELDRLIELCTEIIMEDEFNGGF
ncbi:nucleotidyltransferase domain-containing protein [Bacillus sp. Cs-700]|uniref:nucleotidyltransferase domain-containing protein n=1 Tax=Bacillus sp. Cs-700 TaxID=2589818 RepID=UPI0014080E06|nr:nucleotidyltransferase domain-containing protein [Bacillus sp. Cs-700]